MSDRRELVSDLFHGALKRSPEERTAFLREACGGDHALQQALEALLQPDPTAAGFLETPAAEMLRHGRVDDALMLGRQLGPYKIVALLGAGGMGEVYRARDIKLGREVAIKVLPAQFIADQERHARFIREARILATLSHPHIGAIYGLQETDGMTGLVLELVEGPTLADRLLGGSLPLSDTLTIARQIADALDAAHGKGIVHRDLKPSNIVLQMTTGAAADAVRVRVLDFGLGKLTPMSPPTEATDQHSLSVGTADGRILGSPAYMSPEQARGHPADKRADIWAFGCLLFEMLTGRRAFEGDTVADTFARILEHDPDWTALPAETPAQILRLLQRCLHKDVRKRLRDIADAVVDLDEAGHRPKPHFGTVRARVSRPHPLSRLVWILVGALTLLVIGLGASKVWTRFPWDGVRLTVPPPVGGTVVGGGLVCGTHGTICSTNRPSGDLVELFPVADPGFLFAGFTGDCTPTGRVSMTLARSCAAVFSKSSAVVQGVTRSLSVEKPSGGTIVSAGGVLCGTLGSLCTVNLPEGVSVVLRAVPDFDHQLVRFTGECANGGESVMTADRTCGATFARAQSRATNPQVDRRKELSPTPPTTVIPDPSTLSQPNTTTSVPNGNVITNEEARARQEIEQVVSQYCAELQTLQVQRIRALFPNAPDRVAEQLRNYASLKCSITSPVKFVRLNADTAGGIAEVTYGMKQEIVMNSGGASRTLEMLVTMLVSKKEATEAWFIDQTTYTVKKE